MGRETAFVCVGGFVLRFDVPAVVSQGLLPEWQLASFCIR
jgi:hypothetical protein